MTIEQVWERVEAGAAAALAGYEQAAGGLEFEAGEQRGERVYFVGEPELREHQHYIGGGGSLLASFMVAASVPRGDDTTAAAKAVAGDLRRVRQAVEDALGADAVLAEGSTVRVEVDEATVTGALRP